MSQVQVLPGARALGSQVRRSQDLACAQVRSQVFFPMRHLAQELETAVVEVPARGTSSGCPRCGRDLAASWHIGARGLSS
ncbi:MAG: hypothetical protein ACYCYK_12965 [Candidatus Dormibacteria bacterium]